VKNEKTYPEWFEKEHTWFLMEYLDRNRYANQIDHIKCIDSVFAEVWDYALRWNIENWRALIVLMTKRYIYDQTHPEKINKTIQTTMQRFSRENLKNLSWGQKREVIREWLVHCRDSIDDFESDIIEVWARGIKFGDVAAALGKSASNIANIVKAAFRKLAECIDTLKKSESFESRMYGTMATARFLKSKGVHRWTVKRYED